MKKENVIIIATIIGTLAISIVAFQPTAEASNDATPNATPSPRTKRPKPIQSPITNGIRRKKPAVKFGTYDPVEHNRTQPRKRSTQRRVHKP